MEITFPFNEQEIGFDTNELSSSISFAGRYGCSFPPPLNFKEIKQKVLAGLSDFKDAFSIPRCVRNLKVLTVVNDGYRRTPTSEILSIIWDFVRDGSFIVATGTHRKPTVDELKTIFGEFYDDVASNLYIHDCYDEKSTVNLGSTSSGTPVLINQKVVEADLIFIINSVEPHFFAGFTGGRKSIIPGLAAFETVQSNHRLAKDENSTSLNLETNPLHNDLMEGLKLLGDKQVLTVQCVTDRNGVIIDLFSGGLNDTFLEATSCAAKHYTVQIPEKYDIIIANCEPPLDINLYQLQKAQEHGGMMTADGGALITVGACKEGVGSEYFMKLAEKYPTPETVLEKGMTDDSFGIHKLIKTARQLKHFQVYYVTTLDEDVVRRVYLKPFSDIKMALEKAANEIGKNATLAILDDAGYTVPVLES